MQDMRELQDERAYWQRLYDEAMRRGSGGATFARCLASVQAEIDYREAACPCDEHA